MAPVHGSNADVFGNGYVLSSFFNSASSASSRDAGETTVFKKKSKTYIPGLKDNTLACEGIYDGDADAADAVLFASIGQGSGVFTYYPEGAEVFGSGAYTLDSHTASYEITTDVGDVAQISAEFSAGESGFFDRGQSYLGMAARTTTGNSSSIDGLAQTLNGMAFIIHEVDVTGTLDVVLQDSADNSAFADLNTQQFTVDRQSRRVLVAGTIRRYTRIRWSGTGTFAAAAARL